MNYQIGLGSNPKSATKQGGQTSAHQDSMSSSINGDDSGICAEKKQAQDAAPHLGTGHVAEPSPSNGFPVPWTRNPVAQGFCLAQQRSMDPDTTPAPKVLEPQLQSWGCNTRAISERCLTIADWRGSETLSSGMPEGSPKTLTTPLHVSSLPLG